MPHVYPRWVRSSRVSSERQGRHALGVLGLVGFIRVAGTAIAGLLTYTLRRGDATVDDLSIACISFSTVPTLGPAETLPLTRQARAIIIAERSPARSASP